MAENANTYTPLGPEDERVENDRYVIWMGRGDHPSWNVVQRLRLRPEEVEPTVGEVHSLLLARGRSGCTWEIGHSATPPDLAERLQALGLSPDREPYAVGMVLTHAPPPAPTDVVVRRAETIEEHLASLEIVRECFGMAPDPDALAWAEREGPWATYLAWLDGEPLATGMATFTDAGVVLNGGSTLPRARGRGAYRALVAARWEEAVRRGTPVLITQAGALSRPILRRLGFEEVAEITILLDEFGSASSC